VKVKIEVENTLSDELAVTLDNLCKYSNVPKINIESRFLKTFNKYLIEEWTPLFIKIIDEETNQVLGVFPLMHKTIYRKKNFPYKTLKFFASTFSDFQDIYANSIHRDLVIRESLTWLFKGPFKWQELIVDDLLESTKIIQLIEKYTVEKVLSYTLKKGKYFYINLEQPWEEVKKNTSKSFVWKNVRLAKNRITKAGQWNFEFNPDIDVNEIIERVKPIHSARQNYLERVSRITTKNGEAAYKEVIEYYKLNNEFDTYWLKFEDTYIAYMLGFHIDHVFYWWNTSFLPEYKDFYPTRLLQYNVIDFMHNNGYKEFNFMRGESGYKDKWTNTTRVNYRLRI